METLHIYSGKRTYPIYIEKGLRFQVADILPKNYSSVLVITDETVGRLYLQDVLKALSDYQVTHVAIPPGEASKNIDAFYRLHSKALGAGLDRQSVIIALGGGVVGDLGGFVASTFMRGIDFIQMPTTILAHDSSVGGKVGINHEQGKNLIGSFHPPTAVVYDVETLQTLIPQEIRSGYAELMKEAFLSDLRFTEELLAMNVEHLDIDSIRQHLVAGIKIKSDIVQQDEYEAGVRAYLNLGHTLGHAIEHESGFRTYTHGEAVALGLLFALFVSESMFNTSLQIKKVFEWMRVNGFPLILPHYVSERYMTAMKKDKKTTRSVITMTLLEKVGKPALIQLSNTEMDAYLNSFYTVLQDLSGENGIS